MMRLYWSSRSPFARKVMVAAHETGTAGKIERIRVAVGSALMSEEVMHYNPLNKIPTLVLDDGAALFDSRVIIAYLDGFRGSPRLVPQDAHQRVAAARWEALGDGIMENSTLTIGERKREALHSAKHDAAYRKKTVATLTLLEKEAQALAAAPFGIGAIAIGCALSHLDFRFGDENWRAGRPNLARWFETVATRSSFIATAFEEIY
ncbi:glutathione S-transferase family protein [Chelatococcus sp. GCM10030263]|uniref:glutathione S-transferase family protein n=1 Tax=Chelatococcus sp. GCM10030263 TaxID=3273387 RepID=UPI00361822C4